MSVATSEETQALLSAGLSSLLSARLSSAFRLAEKNKGRDPFSMSMSRLGDCDRQVAYRVSGTVPSNPSLDDGEKRMAWLGTWQHRGLLPNLRLVLRKARVEVPVVLKVLGMELPGRVDLWWRRPASRGGDVVVDVKTVKEWGLTQVREHGIRPRDRWQVQGYALALRQTFGADVRWISIVYIDRASGDTEVLTEAFGWDEAEQVMTRFEQMAQWRETPLLADRTERGPGLSWSCDHCPWLEACWGAGATPGDPSILAIHPLELQLIGEALEAYVEARARESAAKKDKEAARVAVDRAPAGTYGGYELHWGRGKPATLDKAKSWDRLVAAGWDPDDVAETLEVDLVEKPATSRGAIGVSVASAD